MTPTFCRDPWTTLFIGTYGEVRTCCPGETILGYLRDDTLDNILQNEHARTIRQTIADGQWHPNCAQCQHMENNDVPSYRNTRCDDELATRIRSDVNYFAPELLDIRWNSTCQLTCHYCSEKFSSAWGNIKKIDIGTDRTQYASTLQWIEDNQAEVKLLTLLGGEPFLIKENAELLRRIKDETIDVVVVTSLSVALENSRVWDELRRFRTVTISVSFENVGDRYEYVRHNANWDLLRSNIDLVKRDTHYRLQATPIYNVYSATDLVNYYDFLAEKQFDHVLWHKLHWPVELDINNVGPDVKNLARDQIQQVLEKYGDRSNFGIEFLKNVDTVVDSNYNKLSRSNFVTWTGDIEQQLKNKRYSFFELWPELKDKV